MAVPALFLSLQSASADVDPVVVELYTSQGCSSCPPADEMLGALAARDDVIALSLHVDYWDWIGWPDTFGDPAHSDRQRAYAAATRSNMVYTPQFVIGGADHVAGARGMEVADAVTAHADRSSDVLSLGPDGRLSLAAVGRPARIYAAHVAPAATVEIERGENAGRAITYHNVVRAWDDLGAWDGAAAGMDAPAPRDGLRLVVIAQAVTEKGLPGPILGAIALDD